MATDGTSLQDNFRSHLLLSLFWLRDRLVAENTHRAWSSYQLKINLPCASFIISITLVLIISVQEKPNFDHLLDHHSVKGLPTDQKRGDETEIWCDGSAFKAAFIFFMILVKKFNRPESSHQHILHLDFSELCVRVCVCVCVCVCGKVLMRQVPGTRGVTEDQVTVWSQCQSWE